MNKWFLYDRDLRRLCSHKGSKLKAQRWSTIDTGPLLHTEGGDDGTLLLPVCTWIIQPDKNTGTMEPHWNFKPSSPTTINKQSPTHRGGSGGIASAITPGCRQPASSPAPPQLCSTPTPSWTLATAFHSVKSLHSSACTHYQTIVLAREYKCKELLHFRNKV